MKAEVDVKPEMDADVASGGEQTKDDGDLDDPADVTFAVDDAAASPAAALAATPSSTSSSISPHVRFSGTDLRPSLRPSVPFSPPPPPPLPPPRRPSSLPPRESQTGLPFGGVNDMRPCLRKLIP